MELEDDLNPDKDTSTAKADDSDSRAHKARRIAATADGRWLAILLLILRSGCTQSAREKIFPRPIFPEICHFFGKIGRYKLSLRKYKLSLSFLSPLLGGRKFTTFLGKSDFDFPKK